MQIIHEKQDLTYLSWAKIRNSSGTAGSFLKAYSDLGGAKIYYKLSNYDQYKGIIGHECVNEIIVDRLLNILGVKHLEYQLINADIIIDGKLHNTYLCASKDFKERGNSKIALDTYYQLERLEGESPLEFCVRLGFADYIYQMLVVDFLILNRDRHGANIEILRNSRKKRIYPAPLFDHGLSLIFNCLTSHDIQNVNVMEDKRIQCFVGTNSTKENLNLIPAGHKTISDKLKESDKSILFEGLEEIMFKEWQDKVWEMIWKRWQYYEDFCNSR